MTDRSEHQGSPNWPASFWLAWLATMTKLAGRSAPGQLEQWINPGWIFAGAVTVNQQNSSAPETEREIVAAESYGRQLGRISEALAAVIDERPPGAPARPGIEAFQAMQDRIQEIKTHAARGRVDRLLEDLTTLRRDAPADYARIVSALRDLA